MAARFKTVDDLLSDVRSMIDEDNVENVKDATDLLPALNRAQDYASNILSRHYESPMLSRKTVTISDQEFYIPEDSFEQRVEKLEMNKNGLYYPVTRIDYRDISIYETTTKVNIPYYYAVVGKKIRLVPGPTGTYSVRLWYLKDPDPLVTSQGRITRVNAASNYVVVDEVGGDLTAVSDDLKSFVNIIDGQSGTIKATLQIKTITGGKIEFKTSIDGGRTDVHGRTISTSMATSGDGVVEMDDYICLAEGTCVPFFQKPFSNFLVQYAVAEIRRKLGGAADMELRVLEELEKQVERSWVGREQTMRVKKKSKNWWSPTKRWFND